MKPRVLDRYSVYFFPQALEVLGDDAKMFLNGEGDRAHVICREIDTAGALLEMTLECQTTEGEPIEIELMVPSNMVRLIISTRSDGSFGFRPRKPGDEVPAMTAIPGRVPAAAPAQEAQVVAPATAPAEAAQLGQGGQCGRGQGGPGDQQGDQGEGAATSTQTR